MFKRLAAIGRSPGKDWTIGDVETVCANFGLDCRPPGNGSHYIVSHPRIEGLLTIPALRPIKPIHVMLLVEMIEGLEH